MTPTEVDRKRPDELAVDMPVMLSRSEAAELLGVHENTVYRWARKGVLRPHKSPSGLLLYPEHEVTQLKLALQGRGPYPHKQGTRQPDGTIRYE